MRLARVLIWLAGVWAALSGLGTVVNAQWPKEFLQIYAVMIVKSFPFEERNTGDGIYLGHGLIITAAHVIGRWPFLTRPHVLIGGQDLQATVIKEGSFEKTDLALLSVPQDKLSTALRLRVNPLCKRPPLPGAKVIDVTPQTITTSTIISPLLIAQPLQGRYATLIGSPQASGSGLFDAEHMCLIGIISGKLAKFHYQSENGQLVWTNNGFAGYFLSAATIVDFIPSDLRF